jgi:hypothetical protein
MGRTDSTEPQCLYSRAIPLLPLWAVWPVQSLSACRVELYLNSPYGLYGLYRASMSLQGCILLWAVWPVQSLSVSTRVHFTLGCTACTEPQCLYKGALYYGPYGLYRASVSLQGCTLLGAVRPVQSLNVSTRVHFTFYNSILFCSLQYAVIQHLITFNCGFSKANPLEL